jgi:hypothetical protein
MNLNKLNVVNPQSGTVCSYNNWDMNDANFAYRQLGFSKSYGGLTGKLYQQCRSTSASGCRYIVVIAYLYVYISNLNYL